MSSSGSSIRATRKPFSRQAKAGSRAAPVRSARATCAEGSSAGRPKNSTRWPTPVTARSARTPSTPLSRITRWIPSAESIGTSTSPCACRARFTARMNSELVFSAGSGAAGRRGIGDGSNDLGYRPLPLGRNPRQDPLGRPRERPRRAHGLSGAFGPGPHGAEYVPLVGIAADELLEAVDDRLRGVLDVVGGLLGPFDEDGRQRRSEEHTSE